MASETRGRSGGKPAKAAKPTTQTASSKAAATIRKRAGVGRISTAGAGSDFVPYEGALASAGARTIWAAAVFLIVLSVYVLTLAPTVTLVDSGELIVAARFLGVAHPPGVPLYVMLAHLATLLPFGNVAQRVNFASALFASLASGLACLTVIEVMITPRITPSAGGKRQPQGDRGKRAVPEPPLRAFSRPARSAVEVVPAACAGFFLGFSRTLWDYGTIAEVYTLNTLLMVSIYFLMMRWRRRVIEKRFLPIPVEMRGTASETGPWTLRREDIPLYAAALTFGLGLGVHHVTVGLNILGLAGFVLLTEGWGFFVSPRLLYSFLISVCGLGVYAYLPIAASRHPVLNWGDPVTLNRLWLHISGWQYQVFLKGGDTASLAKQFVTMTMREFGPPWAPFVIILAGAGCVALLRDRNIALVAFFALVFLADIGYGLSYEIGEDKDAYYLPVFILLSLAAGFGIRILLELFDSAARNGGVKVAISAALLALPASTLAANYRYSDRSHYRIAQDYVDNIFSTVAPNGMVLTMDWQVYSPMMYVREVEGRRKDVEALDLNLLRRSWYYDSLDKEYPELMRDTRSQVDAFLQDLRAWERNPGLYQTDRELNRRISDRFDQMVLAFVSDNLKRSPVYLTEDVALDFGGENPAIATTLNKTYQLVPHGLVFQLETDRDFHEPSAGLMSMRGLFDGSIAFDPDDVVEEKVIPTYLNMLVNRGRYLAAYEYRERAIASCRETLKLKPDFAPAQNLLGECMSALERRKVGSATPGSPGSRPGLASSP